MGNLLVSKKIVFKKTSEKREVLMYEVLMENGMNGFLKKFTSERQARPLVKHFL